MTLFMMVVLALTMLFSAAFYLVPTRGSPVALVTFFVAATVALAFALGG